MTQPEAQADAQQEAPARRVQQLEARIATTVQDALRGLHDEISARLRQSTQSIEETLASAEAGLPASFIAREDLQPLALEAQRLGRADATAALRGAFAAFDQAASQAEILSSLLVEAGQFASRAAVFLARPEAAEGWGAYGFEELDQALSQVSISWRDGGAWSRLAEGRGAVVLGATDCALLASHLESQVAVEAVLIPLVLADRVAAALYADRLNEAEAFDVPALQSLVYVAGQSLELLALRSRRATPTLLGAGQGTGPEVALALWSPEEEPVGLEAAAPGETVAEEAAPALHPPPEVELFTASPPAAVAPESPSAAWTSLPDEPPAVWEETAAELFGAEAPAPAAEEAWEPEVSPAAAAEEVAAFEAPAAEHWLAPEVMPEPAGAAEAEEPVQAATWETPPEVSPEPEAVEAYEPTYEEPTPVREAAPAPPEDFLPPAGRGAATAEMEIPPLDISEDATLLVSRRPMPAPPPPPPVLSTAAEPARSEADDETRPGAQGLGATRAMPRAGLSPEVTPPTDFFGPGLAFAGRRAPGGAEEAVHEEARRLARLLVSEIRLYNEEQVEEGRLSRDIYGRLKDEIDRSRKMYEERIAPEVRATRDYFGEELVRRLADGDAGALGM